MAVTGILSNPKGSLKDLGLYKKKSTNIMQPAAKIQFANQLNSNATDLESMENKIYSTEQVNENISLKKKRSAHQDSAFQESQLAI